MQSLCGHARHTYACSARRPPVCPDPKPHLPQVAPLNIWASAMMMTDVLGETDKMGIGIYHDEEFQRAGST